MITEPWAGPVLALSAIASAIARLFSVLCACARFAGQREQGVTDVLVSGRGRLVGPPPPDAGPQLKRRPQVILH